MRRLKKIGACYKARGIIILEFRIFVISSVQMTIINYHYDLYILEQL